jgi:hypothetical protein
MESRKGSLENTNGKEKKTIITNENTQKGKHFGFFSLAPVLSRD